MRVIDLVGQRFGFLTVVRRDGTRNTFAAWLVRCDCGTEKTVSGHELRRGRAQSCGCQSGALRSAKVSTHGMTGSPTYVSWLAMRNRCNSPKDPSYDRYGGRGIRVCARWDQSFEAFLEDMGERPSMAHSIDRRDVNGHYEPGNCRWATVREQARNRRRNTRLTYGGLSLTLAEWSERAGISPDTIKGRIVRGWTLHDALTVPSDSKRLLRLRKSA